MPIFIQRLEDPDHGRKFCLAGVLMVVVEADVGAPAAAEGLAEDAADLGRIKTILSSSRNLLSVFLWRVDRWAVLGRRILAKGSDGWRETSEAEVEDEEGRFRLLLMGIMGLLLLLFRWNFDGMGFWRLLSNFTTRPALPTFKRRDRILLEKRET